MRRKSKRRLEMGEERWLEFQKQKWRDKARRSYHNGKGTVRKISHLSGWRLRTKLILIEYKGGKCGRCGYDKKIPRAYDFHHRNPDEKEFSVSKSTVHNIERLKVEVDKCDLLCRNCHAEVHNDPDRVEALLLAHNDWLKTRLEKKICCFCNQPFRPRKSDQKYCKVGCRNNAVGLRRPSRGELEIELKIGNYSRIGRKYGVSSNAVKKWSVKLRMEESCIATHDQN